MIRSSYIFKLDYFHANTQLANGENSCCLATGGTEKGGDLLYNRKLGETFQGEYIQFGDTREDGWQCTLTMMFPFAIIDIRGWHHFQVIKDKLLENLYTVDARTPNKTTAKDKP